MHRLACISLPFIGILLASACLADSLKIGTAVTKVTPAERIFMAGYASRDKPFEKVESELYAKAMSFEDGEGNRSVLITTDLIGFDANVAAAICQQIKKRTGLERDRILLSASHTHTGPVISLNAAARGSMNEVQAGEVKAYTEWLVEEIATLVERSYVEQREAKLSWGIGFAPFVMNRRESTDDGVKLGFNPSGYADRSVPVLRVEDSSGKPFAVLFGAAAHGTTMGSRDYMISGDYAGYAQEVIEARNPGITAMFMLGLAGSSNPYPRGTYDISKRHGTVLGDEVCRLLDSDLAPVDGRLTIVFDQIELPLQSPPTKKEATAMAVGSSGWMRWVGEQQLQKLESGEPFEPYYRAPLTAWQFGDSLTLVALPGEVVGEYIPLIEKAIGPTHLWLAAYCNDVFGYLPTVQTLREGGYETRGTYSGPLGFFRPETEQVMIEKIRELTRSIRPN